MFHVPSVGAQVTPSSLLRPSTMMTARRLRLSSVLSRSSLYCSYDSLPGCVELMRLITRNK